MSRLIKDAEEIIGDHQCGFRRSKTTTDNVYVLCIRQMFDKKWE
jgi:hypothetical protein